MVKSVRNCVELIIVLIVIGAATYSQRTVISDWLGAQTQPKLPVAVEYQEVVQQATLPVPSVQEQVETTTPIEEEPSASDVLPPEPVAQQNESTSLPEELPSSFNLAVPFTSQAPTGDWSEPYKEACEEASLYMVHSYFEGTKVKKIDTQTATTDLLHIVDFEKQLFGFYEDTTAAQTAVLAEMLYGYGHTELIEDPTFEQIKTHIAAGRPVIVPAAGRELGNPYFTAPGPIYHMVVIRGYTEDGKFITNDPGTKHGEQYVYEADTLMNALHDWNGGGEITEGKKVVLVIYPN